MAGTTDKKVGALTIPAPLDSIIGSGFLAYLEVRGVKENKRTWKDKKTGEPVVANTRNYSCEFVQTGEQVTVSQWPPSGFQDCLDEPLARFQKYLIVIQQLDSMRAEARFVAAYPCT